MLSDNKCDRREKILIKRNLPLDKSHFITAVKDAIEIGILKGRSSYFMCAVLMRKNPNLRYVCVDIRDTQDSFEKYQDVLPALDRRIPSTSEDYKGEGFDIVFIDGDHKYNGVWKDYQNVGKYARKITAFHDIYGHEYDKFDGGTVRMWKEVVEDTQDCEHLEFSVHKDEFLGIGVVVWKNRH